MFSSGVARMRARMPMIAVVLMAALGCTTIAQVPGGTITHTTRGQAPQAPAKLAPMEPPKAPASSPPRLDPQITPTAAVSMTSPDGSLKYTQVKVAASIGHEAVITEDEVLHTVRARVREFGDLSPAAQDAKAKELYKEELRELIGRELLIVELFDRMKKNKADAKIEELQQFAADNAVREIGDRRRRMGIAQLSEAEFMQVLQSQGIEYKMLKRQIERDTLQRIYLEQMVKDKVKQISINDLWDYYKANPKDFTRTNSVKWMDLFVSFANFKTADEARAHATKAWKEAMAGGDFATLVKKYGQGDSNLRGGEGIGSKPGEIQPAEFEPVLFDMAAGQVSPLLQTATGYHIVKVIEREKAGLVPFDEKIQTAIRMKLSITVQDQERSRIVEDLWRRHRPKVVDPN
jgi:peptidyl-prolyl cis-trans isomerase SurA